MTNPDEKPPEIEEDKPCPVEIEVGWKRFPIFRARFYSRKGGLVVLLICVSAVVMTLVLLLRAGGR